MQHQPFSFLVLLENDTGLKPEEMIFKLENHTWEKRRQVQDERQLITSIPLKQTKKRFPLQILKQLFLIVTFGGS